MPPTSTIADPAPPTPAPSGAPEPSGGRSRLLPLLLAVFVLPMVISAALLVFDVGDAYTPTADLALIEMQVRDVGRNPVLTGLYSRVDWSHPGPAQFFVLAPFYRLTGSSSVGTFVGALVVNAAAVAGMVVLARRRGGTPLMLITLLASSLLVRTLGADFVRDPWNCFMTVLPFGLAVFLAWALTCGDSWALPVAVGVTSYLAQAHVGFLALAVPLLGFGALWLWVGVLRGGDSEQRRRLLKATLVAVGVGVVLWLPPLIDVLTNTPSNLGNIAGYFRSGGDEPHTIGQAWNVLSAQFSTVPEWLTWHREPTWYSGEPPALYAPPVPFLLAVVAGAGVVLWRRRRSDAARLVVTFAVVFLLGLVAIARTVGPAFDYRLRWTWILGMVAFVVIAWTGWTFLSARWRDAGRVLGPVTVVAIVVVSAINVGSAVGAGTPYEADSDVLAALMPGVLEAVEGTEGEVLVTDTLQGSWYARGVVSELERSGHDARVPEDRRELFDDNRVVSDGVPAARVHVAVNQEVDELRDDPGLRLVSEWSSLPDDVIDDILRRQAELDADLAAGRIDGATHAGLHHDVSQELHEGSDAFGYEVALFLDTDPAD